MQKIFIDDIPVLIHYKKESSESLPLIILSHGFTNSKEIWMEKMEQLADMNYFVASLDNRLHGERNDGSFRDVIMNKEGKLNMYLLRQIKRKTAEDVLTLIDFLVSNYKIDYNRIGMIGISMGGYVTYAAMVMDARIKAAIPFISSPHWDDIPKDTPIDESVLENFYSSLNDFNPSSECNKFYPRRIFMPVGKNDKHFDLMKLQCFYDELRWLYKNEPDNLKLKLYDVAHEVTEEMWNEAIDWLKEKL